MKEKLDFVRIKAPWSFRGTANPIYFTSRDPEDPWENISQYDSAYDINEMYKSKFTFICMNRMGREDRDVFRYIYIAGEGYITSNEELSYIFGVETDKVSNLLRKALRKYDRIIIQEWWEHKRYVNPYVECPKCSGHGKIFALKGYKDESARCKYCHAKVTKSVLNIVKTPCDMCGGTGKINIKGGFRYKGIVISRSNS